MIINNNNNLNCGTARRRAPARDIPPLAPVPAGGPAVRSRSGVGALEPGKGPFGALLAASPFGAQQAASGKQPANS